MRHVGLIIMVLVLHGGVMCGAAALPGASPDTLLAPSASRIGFSAGMGVSYVHPQDVVDLVNATSGGTRRVDQFTSAAEFFGAAVIPLSEDLALKVEYVHLLGNYSVPFSLFGQAEYSFRLHMPSVLLQYLVANEGVYNVKAGAGVGYHLGTLAAKYLSLDEEYTGSGAGVVADLEANTALGEHLFAYLGGNLRWEFVGRLEDTQGRTPGAVASGATTLNLFGIGARLGITYYL